MRLAAEEAAALTVMSVQDYHRFEWALDQLCATRPVSALCQYACATTTGPRLDEVADMHVGGIRAPQLGTSAVAGGLLLEGEVDMLTEEVLTSALRAATRHAATAFRLDLGGVSFLGADGCRAVVNGTARFRDAGGHVLLAAPQPAVERVLRLLRIDQAPRLEITESSRQRPRPPLDGSSSGRGKGAEPGTPAPVNQSPRHPAAPADGRRRRMDGGPPRS